MKKLFVISATIISTGLMTHAQNGFLPPSPQNDPMYSVSPSYKRAIKKEKLNDARYISDVIEGYPSNWISSYVSVEIQATCNGKLTKALSSNEILSTEQKKLLNNIDQATYIVIQIKYIYKEPYTLNVENNKINVTMMVVPETEAEYAAGYQQMIQYLKENITYQIYKTGNRAQYGEPKQFRQGIVRFTINENGEINNAKIFSTSGDTKTDKLLLDAVNKMPKWKPAENSKGEKVKQEFEFWIGNGGC